MTQDLASYFGYVHAFESLQKNICLESILLFEKLNTARSATVLIGIGGVQRCR